MLLGAPSSIWMAMITVPGWGEGKVCAAIRSVARMASEMEEELSLMVTGLRRMMVQAKR